MNARLSARQHRQAALVVWGTMIASTCLYLIVMNLIPAQNTRSMPSLVLPLTGLAVVARFLWVIVRTRFGVRPNQIRSAAATKAAYVVAATLSELPAILGLMVHFVANSGSVLPFIAISVVALLLNFPRGSDFHDENP